jgi:quercetin dioxygenase-like cupin family protein
VQLAGFQVARQVSFLREDAGWYGEQHRAPAPSLYFVLEGELEFETSDGESRRLAAGSVLRTDDTTGKGHATRVVSDGGVLLGVVQLAD